MTNSLTSSLPFETLVRVVTFYRNDYEIDRRRCEAKFRDIRGLSLVCKAFNDACSTILFRCHILRLRENKDRFDLDHAKQRIAVVARKAPYIRTLVIEDGVQEPNDENESYPKEILPELISALNLATGMIELSLDNTTPYEQKATPMSDLLWQWIKHNGNRLHCLWIEGNWRPGDNAEKLDNVKNLVILPITADNMKFPEHIEPKYLHIRNRNSPDIAPFKLRTLGKHLRYIFVQIYMDEWKGFMEKDEHRRTRLLDFSRIPPWVGIEVKVRSTKFSPREDLVGKFTEWIKVRSIVNDLFVDDLREFNVRQEEEDEPWLTIDKWHGMQVTHQDHLVKDGEGDRKRLEQDEEWMREEVGGFLERASRFRLRDYDSGVVDYYISRRDRLQSLLLERRQ